MAERTAVSTATRSSNSTRNTCASTSSAAATSTKRATGRRPRDANLNVPLKPTKFVHTAGNFQEHHEESTRVNWSHPVLPWIVFFQNVDAIVGPGERVIYPEALTNELDYELELAVVI